MSDPFIFSHILSGLCCWIEGEDTATEFTLDRALKHKNINSNLDNIRRVGKPRMCGRIFSTYVCIAEDVGGRASTRQGEEGGGNARFWFDTGLKKICEGGRDEFGSYSKRTGDHFCTEWETNIANLMIRKNFSIYFHRLILLFVLFGGHACLYFPI